MRFSLINLPSTTDEDEQRSEETREEQDRLYTMKWNSVLLLGIIFISAGVIILVQLGRADDDAKKGAETNPKHIVILPISLILFGATLFSLWFIRSISSVQYAGRFSSSVG